MKNLAFHQREEETSCSKFDDVLDFSQAVVASESLQSAHA